MITLPLLTYCIWLPILAGLLISIIPHKATARIIGIFVSALTVLLSLILVSQYQAQGAIFQFSQILPWISALNINYHLSVDAISISLIVLTAVCTFLVLLFSFKDNHTRPSLYVALFLIMEGLMIGVFCAQDIVLFYVFFEAMLIPMYLLIGLWGGSDRIVASFKFFLYTLVGSILFLLAILYIGLKVDSFHIQKIQNYIFSIEEQKYLFIAFLFAFGIKIPMWPVHTWLPHAHVEAPTGGSVILAAITLKIGAYAMIRFMLPVTAFASVLFAPLMIVLSLIAIVYIGFVAFSQSDMKKIIAYSSVAHMGFVTLGFFSAILMMYKIESSAIIPDQVFLSFNGAYFQLLSHGIISAALFFGVGYLYKHTHTRDISEYGGVAKGKPFFGTLFVLFSLANCGLPGTSGFIGEFFVIVGSFSYMPIIALIAASALILGALYSLWMARQVIFGPVNSKTADALESLNIGEYITFGVLGLAIVYFGMHPNSVFQFTNTSIHHVIQIIFNNLHSSINI